MTMTWPVFPAPSSNVGTFNTEARATLETYRTNSSTLESEVIALDGRVDDVEIAVQSATTGSYILVSGDDSLGGNLETKLISDDGSILFETNNPGAVETRSITVNPDFLYPDAQEVTAAASTTINLDLGKIINLTHSANITTLAFSNVPDTCEVTIVRNGGTYYGLTWPSSVLWNNNETPIFTPTSENVIRLLTVNGGTTWRGSFEQTALVPGFAVGCSASPYVLMFDKYGKKITNPSTLPAAAVYEAAFSPDGSKMAVAFVGSPYLIVYNTSDWSTVTLTGGNPDGNAVGVAFNPAGTLLAVAHGTSPYVTVYNTSTWAKVTLTGGNPAGNARAVSFSGNGTWLAVAHVTTPYLTVYNTSTWAKITLGTTNLDGNTSSARFNSDSSHLALVHGGTNGLIVLSTTTWADIAHPDPAEISSTPTTISYSPLGGVLALRSTPSNLTDSLTIYRISGSTYTPLYIPRLEIDDFVGVSQAGITVCFDSTGQLLLFNSVYSPAPSLARIDNFNKVDFSTNFSYPTTVSVNSIAISPIALED